MATTVLVAVSITVTVGKGHQSRSALPQKYESHLDRVSTGSDSDLVQPSESKILREYCMPITDQVATAPCTDPIQVRFVLLRQSRHVGEGPIRRNSYLSRRYSRYGGSHRIGRRSYHADRVVDKVCDVDKSAIRRDGYCKRA